jgi:hypothetical protein
MSLRSADSRETRPAPAVRHPSRPLLVAAACGAVALASLALPSTPTYDPWAWLIWGRELVGLDLDTTRGPAWKPLPVAVDAALAPLGSLAPAAWLLLARAASLAALPLAFRLAARLAPRPLATAAGLLAAAGVALTEGVLWHGAVGNTEVVVLALALLALDRHRGRRPGQAFAVLAVAGLLRVEVWPFLAAYGLHAAWRDRRWLVPAAATACALLAVWFVPDWAGSGSLTRSSERARQVEPGAPALATRPVLASATDALALPPLPLTLAAGAGLVLAARAPRGSRRRAVALPAAAGGAWIGLVAAMSELGYSGEARYALPGAALLCVPGAVALAWVALGARRHAPAAAVVGVALAGGIVASAWSVPDTFRRLGYEAELYTATDDAVAAAGGRHAVVACGRPVTGPLAVPAVAWALELPMSALGHVDRLQAPAVAFASAPTGHQPVAPAPAALREAGLEPVGGVGPWRVFRRCGGGAP